MITLKKSITNYNLKNKKVIIRCDLNVPIKNGKIIDNTRIKNSIPTIEYAYNHHAKIIILSHLGRIKTKEDLKANTLQPVANMLEQLLQHKVTFINSIDKSEINKVISSMKPQDIVLLQNTRYEDLEGKKESNCDMELAKYWASLGDIFINDAFGTLHRNHASNVGIAKYLPNGIGLLVQKELTTLQILDNPLHPFVLITGGSKVKDKIHLLERLLPKCDYLLIGGGMAFTFLQAEGYETGNSIIDRESLDFCHQLLEKYQEKIILPVDVCCHDKIIDEKGQNKSINEIEYDDIGLDIGKSTIKLFEKYLTSAKMVVWNGPLGVYELKNYQHGTIKLLKFLVKAETKTILAGGDIISAASNAKVKDKIYFASTGGGATLTYLEGGILPGLEAIEEEENGNKESRSSKSL